MDLKELLARVKGHTPAPWSVGKKTKLGTFSPHHIYAPDGESSVCQVYEVPVHCTREEIGPDPRYKIGLANAELIAAAPDLLAQLSLAEEEIAKLRQEKENLIESFKRSQ